MLGGVSGWRQPSGAELFTLHKNLGATYPGPVPLPQPLLPGLRTDDDSWTGEDRDTYVAYIFDFTDGNTRISIKWYDYCTWAVYKGKVPIYSVGGSVLGLSGPVTLQNNGGDDLTVSADGRGRTRRKHHLYVVLRRNTSAESLQPGAAGAADAERKFCRSEKARMITDR
jgi:hypothetical protein